MGEAVASKEAVESVAVQVTLFEDRAEVLRRARCVVPAGVSEVRLAGVGVGLDDASLVASAEGEGARVLSARVLRVARSVSVLGEVGRAEAEAEVLRAREAERAAEAVLARAEAQRARHATLADRWMEGVREVPRGTEADAGAGATAWRAAFDAVRARLDATLDAVRAATGARDAARRDRRRAEARWTLAQRAERRHEAVVSLQVEAAGAGEVDFVLRYRTPCALWRPEHVARLDAAGDGEAAVSLETWATAWQATGERWEGVALRFSTARPTASAACPLDEDDVLGLRRKTEMERQTVQVSLREQAVQKAGAEGARDLDEMPGVDDGGEALWLDAPGASTLPSDGGPFRVRLGAVTLPAEVERVAMPERAEAVYVRATATLKAPTALLAGPVRLARGGEFVGRGRVEFVGRGEPFVLGFGLDDGVRVRRRVDDKRETTAVMGTQKLQRTVRLALSNLSGETRTLRVIERVPVSEIEDVKVQVVPDAAWAAEGADGMVSAAVSLAPHETRELSLVWRLEANSKVVLPV